MMKKLILILTLIFALTLCFVACEKFEDNSKQEEITTNEAAGQQEQITLPLLSDEEKEKELISELTEYLKNKNVEFDAGELVRFDEHVKRGAQPLHVQIDPKNYYYMCGYYNVTHNYGENHEYCCAKNYTWVKFEKAAEISETYKDQKFVVAFQINKAALVHDISPEKSAVPEVEYFQLFETQFKNGYNETERIALDKTFLYANFSDKGSVFCYEPLYESGLYVISENRKGEYYIVDKQYNFYSLDEFIKRYIKK